MINITELHTHIKKLINLVIFPDEAALPPAPLDTFRYAKHSRRTGKGDSSSTSGYKNRQFPSPPTSSDCNLSVEASAKSEAISSDHLEYFAKRNISRGSRGTIIVGLSGGADSVFLLHQFVLLSKTTKLNIIAAHLQHDWRGQADETDAIFCKELAANLGVQFATKHARDIVTEKKWNGSQEELGRHQRRAFLHQVLTEHNANAIALGHHAQDQEETFFIRLLRGASLEGLCGMQTHDGFIIRPLLKTQRSDIEEWLTAQGHSWCHDSDNTNHRFLRNRIRHELLPVLRNIDQRFTTSFARTLQQLQQEQMLIDEYVQTTFEQIFNEDGSGDLCCFKGLSPMLQGHLLKKLFIINGIQFNLSEGFIDEALRFLNSPRGGTHQLGETWALHKKMISFQLIRS